MSTLWLIFVMALAVYTLCLSGFLLAAATVPPAWERALGFVPVATLSALVVASLSGRPDEGVLRWIAVVVAAWATRRTRRVWVCIVVGMAVYALLRFVQTMAG